MWTNVNKYVWNISSIGKIGAMVDKVEYNFQYKQNWIMNVNY